VPGEDPFVSPFPFRAFLSHSNADADLTSALRERLEGVGVELYLAEHDVRPGTLLSEKVQRAIARSHALIVLLTKVAADSAFVQQEIGYGLSCGVPVVPLVELHVPPSKLAMLEGREYIVLDRANPEKALNDAESYLNKLKGKKEWKDLGLTFMVIGAIIFLISGEGGGAGASA
jgi:hypothetical protein